ncbi:hypothetical protein [Nocardioides marinus]|uniref:Lipoprotein LpqN n=1 Tax=Nocardioides marinus TaxID=374514 RepID=A0A7Z0C503_9ACTN|nr:hypothetical protein [Nocardioides marinus]NYI11842.1 hypothetical protein [Nocardioides marinus]
MDGRRLGLAALTVVAMAATGAGLGYAGADDAPEPLVVDAGPVAAADPDYPQDREVRVLEDPEYPTLEPGLPASRRLVGTSPFAISLPVPRGWVRSDSTAGEARFYPEAYSEDIKNTYFVRVRLVANQYLSVAAQLDTRIHALSTASGIEGFTLESRSFDALVATYVSEGYRRVAMEQYVAQPGQDTAFAYVAVIGREQDRDGLADLLDRLVSGLRYR